MANAMAKSSCDGLLTMLKRVYSRSTTMSSASAGNSMTKTNACEPLFAARYSAVSAGLVDGVDISVARFAESGRQR